MAQEKSKKLELTESVAATPAVTFAVFTDFANAAETFTNIEAAEVLTNGPVGPGTRFRETRVFFGREATEEMEITRFDPPNAYTTRAFSHGTEYRSGKTFTAEEGGGTRVLSVFEAFPQSLMARLMSLFAGMMQKSLVQAMRQDLEDGKAAAEARAAGAAPAAPTADSGEMR